MPIYEHTFTAEEAEKIVRRTIDEGANFRSSMMSAFGGKGNLRQKMPTHRTRALINAMQAGTWRWTDAAPIRASDGRLTVTDGLTRLTACWLSGIPLRAMVYEGDEWAMGDKGDRGRPRTLTQELAHRGVSQPSAVAAITRMHLLRVLMATHNLSKSASHDKLQDDAVYALEEQHHDDLQSIVRRCAAARTHGLNGNGYGVALFEIGLVDPDMRELMHADLIDMDLAPSDPLARLRLATVRAQAKTGAVKTMEWTVANVIKAHNKRVAGESAGVVWRPALVDVVVFPVGLDIAPAES